MKNPDVFVLAYEKNFSWPSAFLMYLMFPQLSYA